MSGAAHNVVQAGRVGSVAIRSTDDRRGVIALVVVALALTVTVALVALYAVDDRLRDRSGGDFVAAVSRLQASCESGWVVPGWGDAFVLYTDQPPSAGAVMGSGGEVVVTVQGLVDRAVVLQSIEVEVVRRATAVTGAYLPRWCQGEVVPREYSIDLDAHAPRIVAEPGTVGFPYRVDGFEPEQFVLTAETGSADVEWRLVLSWTSGADSGRLTIDDGGKPFRTTATSSTRTFCVDHSEGGVVEWRPSC